MADLVRIGNAQGFWGDSDQAPARLLRQQPDLDYLTLDYLAEVSLSLLVQQQQRDPASGYARDFLDVVRSLTPLWRSGNKTRLISNAGGLNPYGCALACRHLLATSGCGHLRVAVVAGDDVLTNLQHPPNEQAIEHFRHAETGESLTTVSDRLAGANAYLGAEPVARALETGAHVIITGRVADPSLTVAPCIHHFGWSLSDWNKIAGATVAGHLIECGVQVTGGISTDWLDVPKAMDLGFPIVEVLDDGSCVVTKAVHAGGWVNERTVKEQLLYEIGDPAHYLSPDCTVSFLGLQVRDFGDNRVRVTGALGAPPPPTYKVSAAYDAGFRASGTLTIFGRDAVTKAKRCAAIVYERLRSADLEPERWLVECLGTGAAGLHTLVDPARDNSLMETVLRLSAADRRRAVLERFSRELMPLITAGPQGVCGYSEGRPKVHPVYGYWPCLIDRALVHPEVDAPR